jgi:hypothetical protein
MKDLEAIDRLSIETLSDVVREKELRAHGGER